MVPRPSWKGYLKLSLVSCPVALYPASNASEKLSFHLLNGETGHRLKQQYVDAETGEVVERDEQVKGFEVAKDDYVVVTDDDLAAVKIESSHTIDIETFVPLRDVDRLYFDSNYYLTPDDKIGEEAFAVIRDAMRQRDMVGIARVALFGRERMIMLDPRAKGMVGTTLHYGYEVRAATGYFDELPEVKVTKELLDLAMHIIDTKVGAFQPDALEDRYHDAVAALIRAKQEGRPAPADPGRQSQNNVFSLMDALRRSLAQPGAQSAGKTKALKPAARANKARAAKSPAKADAAKGSPAKTASAKAKRQPRRKAS